MVNSMGMLDFTQLDPERRRPITRAEYHVMGEAGLFERERVELLDGVIVRMSPRSEPHDSVIERLNELILPRLVGRARVRIQLGFAASEHSEPEPDVAIVPKDEQREDQPARATLVIEVALSSLRFDRTIKASIYARAGVAEYWVVNVANRSVEVHSSPGADRYTEQRVLRGEERLSIPGFPELTLSVDEVFG
jgi:Uma2 family endonuclease